MLDLATFSQNGQNVQNVGPDNILTKCVECPKCQTRQHFHKMIRMFKMLGPATFSQNVQNVQNVRSSSIFTKCPECSKCWTQQHFHKLSDCSEIHVYILCLKLLGKHFVKRQNVIGPSIGHTSHFTVWPWPMPLTSNPKLAAEFQLTSCYMLTHFHNTGTTLLATGWHTAFTRPSCYVTLSSCNVMYLHLEMYLKCIWKYFKI